MPVLASRYCKELPDGAKWFFCPSSPSFLIGGVFPSCYRTDVQEFPVRFLAKIYQEKGDDVRQCKILLHGFLQPERWHYKFWKHTAGGTDTADCEELERWKDILIIPIPSASFFNTQCCRERLIDPKQYKLSRCEPCAPIQFIRVQADEASAIREYLESGDSFFVEASNRKIRWRKMGGDPVLIDFVAQSLHDSTFNHLLVLRGACYDWDALCPTMYLYPWTYYFRRSCLPHWSDGFNSHSGPEWHDGRIDNVIRTK